MGLRPLDPYDLEVLSVASANKNAPISITATIRNPIITGYGHPDGIAKSIKYTETIQLTLYWKKINYHLYFLGVLLKT